ncbi:MAG: putative oxidoreductase UxuB [Lentisphaerae bacterium ADurb.BinA184]|nr:MAG: putative oxidoreductase UxuB [Lentisphaerae bacterium ADurb.BinA184]
MLPFTVDLRGQVAVVTGGSGVLCSRMALALAECGASVAILGRDPAKLDKVRAAIAAAGGTARAYSCDVLDRAALEKVGEAVARDLGPCRILVNGAGGNHPKAVSGVEVLRPEHLRPAPGAAAPTSFFDISAEGLQAVFGVNFVGLFIATQVFARGMAERGEGVIINLTSMAGERPLTKVGAYGAAKAAVANLTRWLAVHLAGVNVRVNAISPGFFLTEQNRPLLTTPDGGYSERARKIVAHTPLGRFGEADELIGTLLWLVSPAAAGFVTGAVIPVDGGFSAYSGV